MNSSCRSCALGMRPHRGCASRRSASRQRRLSRTSLESSLRRSRTSAFRARLRREHGPPQPRTKGTHQFQETGNGRANGVTVTGADTITKRRKPRSSWKRRNSASRVGGGSVSRLGIVGWLVAMLATVSCSPAPEEAASAFPPESAISATPSPIPTKSSTGSPSPPKPSPSKASHGSKAASKADAWKTDPDCSFEALIG